jgi:hypothetical protein
MAKKMTSFASVLQRGLQIQAIRNQSIGKMKKGNPEMIKGFQKLQIFFSGDTVGKQNKHGL